jgi:hypothetical protein
LLKINIVDWNQRQALSLHIPSTFSQFWAGQKVGHVCPNTTPFSAAKFMSTGVRTVLAGNAPAI